MSDAATVVETVAVSKDYGSVHALRDVTVRVHRGELFGLVGPDGAGKTTLLRTLAGLLRPTRGQLFIDGTDVVTDPTAAKHKIGYMSQRFSLTQTLSVIENLRYIADIWNVPAREQASRIVRLLEFSRLTSFQDRLAANLSGGMKQKLSLCAALIHQPHILLLDEPTIGVDPLSRRDFWLILYELLQTGTTILLSTPYMDEAERCTRVAFLRQGHLLACGTPDELRAGLGTVVLDVRCDHPRRARQQLHAAGFPSTPALFGAHLHFTVPRAQLDPARTIAAIEQAGVRVEAWRVREPSLEDVFLAYERPQQPPSTAAA